MSTAISGAQWRRDGMPKGRPFKKGESGNPSGRPKALGEITELARQHSPAAIAALVKALDDPERAIPAAIALLDRAWGKPPVALVAQVQANVWPGGIDGPPRIQGSLKEWLARRRRELGLDPPAGSNGRETEKQWEERANRELDLLTSDRSQHRVAAHNDVEPDIPPTTARRCPVTARRMARPGALGSREREG